MSSIVVFSDGLLQLTNSLFGVFSLQNIFRGLFYFGFFYPIFMSYVWITGALVYFWRREMGKKHSVNNPPPLSEYPGVSILVPCFNESSIAEETISFLIKQNYPTFEIIAINDGSTDNTAEILDELAERYDNVRIIQFKKNQGKAMALRAGALLSQYEFLICIDGDALLSPNASTWIVKHFLSSPRVGAVTGNPRIRTRSTLLGRIQVGEFSAVVGLIKRAQRTYGRFFSVSGVVTGFRKAALHRVGYWSIDMITEDIDITWKLQMDFWDIRFEPNATSWILMPETFRGLWNQRLRWAQGGAEVTIRYFKKLMNWRSRRMLPVLLDYSASLLWSYTIVFIFILWILSQFISLPEIMRFYIYIPNWLGLLFGLTFALQFIVSMIIDSRYEKGVGKIYYWLIWYPIVYWLISVSTAIVAFPKALFKRSGARAIWTSPDRGLR